MFYNVIQHCYTSIQCKHINIGYCISSKLENAYGFDLLSLSAYPSMKNASV